LRGDGLNIGGPLSDELFIALNVRFELGNFLFNDDLLLSINSGDSLLGDLQSVLDIGNLLLVAGELLFLLVEFLSQGSDLLGVFGPLLVVLDLLLLVGELLLLANVLLLDNVSGLNTLADVGDGLFLSGGSIVLRSLNLGVDFGDLSGGLVDFVGDDSQLRGLFPDVNLDVGDISGDGGEFTLEILDFDGVGGSGDLGVDLLLLGSVGSDLALVVADLLVDLDNCLLVNGHLLLDLFNLDDRDFLDLGGFLSQFSGSLLLINDLSGNVGR